MIKAIILDDELRGAQTLRHKLEYFAPEVEVDALFTDPVAALREIDMWTADVLFLDVDMPQLNGFEFLQRLGEFRFEVIFTTAHSSYALEALRVSAVDYLLKPIDQEELERAIDRLKKRLGSRKEQPVAAPAKPAIEARLPLPTQQGIHLIKMSEILRVEAMSNYSAFYLVRGKKIVVSRTLKEYENLLPEALFMRINRSTILNLDYVVKYRKGEGGTLELTDGTEVEVSPHRKAVLLSRLMIG